MMLSRNKHFFIYLVIFIAVLALFSTPEVHASVDPNNSLDKIVDVYKDKSKAWQGTLAGYAKSLFWILATIEFTWAMITLALKEADFAEWTANIVNQILFIGFFYTLLVNAPDFCYKIVNSFATAANSASASAGGQSSASPSDIFDIGLQVANKIMDKVSFWRPGDSLGLMISALVIIVCFALMSARVTLAIIETYIVISAGCLFMGFGGSRWTKDISIKMLVFALSSGAKLYIMLLITGLGQSLINDWLVDFDNNNVDVFVMVGSSIVMLALVWIIPDLIQSLINGTQGSSGTALQGASMAIAGATAGFIAGTAGASSAMSNAGKLASAQLSSAQEAGTAPKSMMGKASFLATNTAKNLASAGSEDIGKRLSGRAFHGTTGGRMAESMKDKTAQEQARSNKPPETPSNNTSSTSSSSKPKGSGDNNTIEPDHSS